MSTLHKPMSRGDFYKLVVRQLYAGQPQAQAGMTAETASAFLDSNGVFPPAVSTAMLENLSVPIAPNEALGVVAAVIDLKSSGRAKSKAVRAHSANKQAGHWFAQPAFAAEPRSPQSDFRPLTYLDAAQIVLQASSGLR